MVKLLTLLIMLFSFSAEAANWYVSRTGAGLKNGTSYDNAWAQTGVVWSKNEKV